MCKTKKIAMSIVAGLCLSFAAHSQDTTVSLAPKFSASVESKIGVSNIDKNALLNVVPGFSVSDITTDLNLGVTGSFNRASQWATEKDDGITEKSNIGYEASMSVNIADIGKIIAGKDAYNSASDANFYALIQPMIDWYEANKVRFNLPDNPCGTLDGSPWPTTSYDGGSGKYQFIHGTTVEKAEDVLWSSARWDDAKSLYNEIKNKVGTKIDALYSADLSTGNVGQYVYVAANPDLKAKAELKQQALDEFSAVSKGKATSSTTLNPVSSAWFKVTNIFGVMDVRMDFCGSQLKIGNTLESKLASTSEKGASLSFALKNGLVKGLSASLSSGIAGGEKQTPENWDTKRLDYYSGLPAELALRADVSYNTYFEDIGSALRVQGQYIMSDLLRTPLNLAADVNAHWDTTSKFVSGGVDLEGMYAHFSDRKVTNAKAINTFSIATGVNVRSFGAKAFANAQYKAKGFSTPLINSVEDRFWGMSCKKDFLAANLDSALMWSAGLSFNPQYFIHYDIVTLEGGVRLFHYGNTFIMNGFGWYGTLKTDLYDLTKIPLSIEGGASYYKNSKITQWADMSSLPKETAINAMSWHVGLNFTPVDSIKVGLNYTSKPSESKRNAERISAVQLTTKISF